MAISSTVMDGYARQRGRADEKPHVDALIDGGAGEVAFLASTAVKVSQAHSNRT